MEIASLTLLAKEGLSVARIAVRFGLSVATVRKYAQANGIKLVGVKDLRRRNGLPPTREMQLFPDENRWTGAAVYPLFTDDAGATVRQTAYGPRRVRRSNPSSQQA